MPVELNAPPRRGRLEAYRQHLITAADALYQAELRCGERGGELPAAAKQARALVRFELRRLAADAVAPAEVTG
jgi:hypothetical protein